VLATQVRQKDSVYYFVSYPGDDLLDKVQFISRYYGGAMASRARMVKTVAAAALAVSV
jgi:hypothetical protein